MTGGTYNRDKGVYLSEDGKTEYKLEEDRLIVKRGVSTITINGYKKDFKDERGNAYLNIALVDPVEIEITLHGGVIGEGNQKEMSGKFKISLDKELKNEEYITLKIHDNNVKNKEQIIKLTSKNYSNSFYEFYWEGNTHANQDQIYSPSAEVIDKSDIVEVRIKSENIVIKDDDRKYLGMFWMPQFSFGAGSNTGPEFGVVNLGLRYDFGISFFKIHVDYYKDCCTGTGKPKYGFLYLGDLEEEFPTNDLIENKIAVWDSNHGELGVLYDQFPDYSLLEKHLLYYKDYVVSLVTKMVDFKKSYLKSMYFDAEVHSSNDIIAIVDEKIQKTKYFFDKTKEIFDDGPKSGDYTVPEFHYEVVTPFNSDVFIIYQREEN